MTHTAHRIAAFIEAAAARIAEKASEVAELDQAIGDGDHLINLQRGLAALQTEADTLQTLDWPAALKRTGSLVMTRVGGASGSLYATLFLGMSRALQDQPVDRAHLAAAFAAGVEAVKQRGKADRGEKTLLDVLIPVADEWLQVVQARWPNELHRARLDEAATRGCMSTRDMIATKGRASFLGERARGYLDPGARTCELMLQGILAVWAEAVTREQS